MSKEANLLKQWTHLYEIAAKMNTLDLENILQLILEGVTQGLGFDRARLYIYDPNENCLYCKMSAGMKMEVMKEIRIPVDKNASIVARTLIEKKPFIIKDAQKESGVHKGLAQLFNIKSFASAPLMGRYSAKGVITADYLYSQKSIHQDMVETLVVFANQAGLALENAETHDQLKILNLELEQRVQKATKDLREAQRMLLNKERIAAFGQMAAGLAHEIRNPLTSMNLLLDNLIEKLNPDNVLSEDLHIVQKETKRLNQLMDQLLQFARTTTISFQPVDLFQLIKNIIQLIEPRCQMQNIKIHTILNSDKKLEVPGDKNQLYQVLLNLAINSIEAMEHPGSLTFEIQEDPYSVMISISDTGKGITEQDLEKIFRPFYTTKPKGTGLGLATVQKIIHEHQGKIQVESRINQGTCFKIYLLKEISVPTHQGET